MCHTDCKHQGAGPRERGAHASFLTEQKKENASSALGKDRGTSTWKPRLVSKSLQRKRSAKGTAADGKPTGEVPAAGDRGDAATQNQVTDGPSHSYVNEHPRSRKRKRHDQRVY